VDIAPSSQIEHINEARSEELRYRLLDSTQGTQTYWTKSCTALPTSLYSYVFKHIGRYSTARAALLTSIVHEQAKGHS